MIVDPNAELNQRGFPILTPDGASATEFTEFVFGNLGRVASPPSHHGIVSVACKLNPGWGAKSFPDWLAGSRSNRSGGGGKGGDVGVLTAELSEMS
ncbi:hypothetical protein TNIN_427771 [Trichonephila inaurata madagascariensis]|uniref:Uncharacterized protein n=1 Tax=Trichonephila inaurata madagascariensis TaxID=2747483 RepID=A0A8X7CP06_9ARAC|nr:hypothetical protein TNIN_427771 [Trichonephila inaurata madagascariensis]